MIAHIEGCLIIQPGDDLALFLMMAEKGENRDRLMEQLGKVMSNPEIRKWAARQG